MATPEILQDIYDGNPHSTLSEESYNSFIKPMFDTLEKDSVKDYKSVKFDPEKHLKYYQDDLQKHKFHNTRRLTMEELGLSNEAQISPIGVSDPFPLFTEEAVSIMKREFLAKDLFLAHARYSHDSTSGRDCTVRGFVQKKNGDILTPFINEAVNHPKTMELINMMAGTDLAVAIPCEIAHINVSMRTQEQVDREMAELQDKKPKPMDDEEEIDAVVGWHYDSYPFVCVIMLSDTTNMIGGETSLRLGKGQGSKITSVPGPTLGSAAILQGRLIQHIAPNPKGVTERITLVISFRPKDPLAPDTSVLKTVKPELNRSSNFDEFYPEWVNYRTDVITKRLQALNKTVQTQEKFDKEATMATLKSIEEYLTNTYKEMEVSDEEWKIIAGNYNKLKSIK